MKYLAIVCITALSLWSCSENGTAQTDDNQAEEFKPSLPQKPQVEPFDPGALPQAPEQLMFDLWDDIQSIQVILYNQNYNITMQDTNASRTILKMISIDPPGPILNCEPQGRLFFERMGDKPELEAHIHIGQEGCNYLVFFEDGKPSFANNLTVDGTKYFGGFLNQTYEEVIGNPENIKDSVLREKILQERKGGQ